MRHIFVCHAGKDKCIADQLADDLKNVGHEVLIDTKELTIGMDVISFMNDAIEHAHAVVLLYSKHSKSAIFQNAEISAIIYKAIIDSEFQLLPIRLDETDLPPLIAPKCFAKIEQTSDPEYSELLNNLAKVLIPTEGASYSVSKAFSENSPNPFWRLRAEYFDEIPKMMGEAFSPPSAEKVALLEERKPAFIEGSRGTGKTMLLMSLRARVLSARPNCRKSTTDIFGFYLRLTKGAFCNSGFLSNPQDSILKHNLSPKVIAQLLETFSQEFFVSIIESLIGEILFCIDQKIFTLTKHEEAAISADISKILAPSDTLSFSSIEDLSRFCGGIHRSIAEFTKRRFIYEEDTKAPIASLDIDGFREIIRTVKQNISALNKSQFTLLLDEYENLFDYQKWVVNDLVKGGPPEFTIKITRKVGTNETPRTSSSQDLQEIHDYNRISLIYSVSKDEEFRSYCDLLEAITKNLLRAQGMEIDSLKTLLPRTCSRTVREELLRDEVWNMLGGRKSADLSETDFQYYADAAEHRIIYRKRSGERRIIYSGIDDLAFLSSGVIRFFQEMMGMAYHIQYGGNEPDRPISISSESQRDAVYIVSEHNLSAISRNLESNGEKLKYFLVDLGDAMRAKLLYHSSEPESGSLAISDPQCLLDPKYKDLEEFLTIGIREGLFQAPQGRSGIRPKHIEDPQPVELSIARVFAPALQFSPRYRWPVHVKAELLRDLLDPEQRKKAKARLIRQVARGKKPKGEQDNQLGLEGM